MKKDVVLLTKLLVSDDKFNAKFFSAATEEQMYALAKTKFPYFTQDEFSQFLQKLQKASDLCKQKLSPEELAEISGGAGSIGNKIASVMLAFTAGFSVLGATPVETNATIDDILDAIGIGCVALGGEDYSATARSGELYSVYCFLLGIEPDVDSDLLSEMWYYRNVTKRKITIHNVNELIIKLDLPPVFAVTQEDALISIKRTNLKNELRNLFARYNWGTEYDREESESEESESEESESEEFEAAPLALRLEAFRLLKRYAPDLGNPSLRTFLAACEERDGNIVYKNELLLSIADKLQKAHNNVRKQLKNSELYKHALSEPRIDCGAKLGEFTFSGDAIEEALLGKWKKPELFAFDRRGYTWLARRLANQSVQAVNSLPDEERNLLLAMDVDRSLPIPAILKIGEVPGVAIEPGFLQNLANFSIDPSARRRAVSSLNVVEKRDVVGNIWENLEFPEDWTWIDYKEAIRRCIQLGRWQPKDNYNIIGGYESVIGLDDAYGCVPLAVVFNPASHEIISFRPAIEEIPADMIVRFDRQTLQMQSMENIRQMEEDDRQEEIVPEQHEEELPLMEEVPERQNEQPRRDRSNSRIRNRSNSRNRNEHEERSAEEQTGTRRHSFDREERNLGQREQRRQSDPREDWFD